MLSLSRYIRILGLFFTSVLLSVALVQPTMASIENDSHISSATVSVASNDLGETTTYTVEFTNSSAISSGEEVSIDIYATTGCLEGDWSDCNANFDVATVSGISGTVATEDSAVSSYSSSDDKGYYAIYTNYNDSGYWASDLYSVTAYPGDEYSDYMNTKEKVEYSGSSLSQDIELTRSAYFFGGTITYGANSTTTISAEGEKYSYSGVVRNRCAPCEQWLRDSPVSSVVATRLRTTRVIRHFTSPTSSVS